MMCPLKVNMYPIYIQELKYFKPIRGIPNILEHTLNSHQIYIPIKFIFGHFFASIDGEEKGLAGANRNKAFCFIDEFYFEGIWVGNPI